jgi:hypothetical protein
VTNHQRQELARRLTIVGLAPLLISAGLFLYYAAIDHDPRALIPAALIAAVMFFGWHAPGGTGLFLLLFTPIGLFLVVLGSTNLDPTSKVIEGLAFFGGIPFISGVLLIIAGYIRARPIKTHALKTENRSRYGRESGGGSRSRG